MGVNEIKKVPRFVAEWLKLENPELYTGHSLRRTCATHLADAGAPVPMMKHKFNWNSEKMTNEYISSSKKNQSTVAGLLDNQVSSPAEMGADGRLVQHQSQNHQIHSAGELEVGNGSDIVQTQIIPTTSPNTVSRKQVILLLL